MCKAKDEGPRCSHGGRVRMERADRYMEKITAKADAEMAKRGKLSPKTEAQLDNAQRRLRQAKIVFHATPAGWKKLEDERDIEVQRLSNMPKGKPGSKEASAIRKVEQKIRRLERQAEKGKKDREIMRRNKQILKPGEKRNIRNKMIAQGANMNERAQRSTDATAAMNKSLENDVPIELEEWTHEDVKGLATHWVEDDSRTGWQENPNIRQSKDLKGEKFAPSTSNMLRMNTPDGMVAEVRIDVHRVKKADGKYAVEVRRTSAATNLQSSPYDTVGGDLGSLISSKTGAMSRRVQSDYAEFKTEAEANAYAIKVQRSTSQKMADDLAVETRATLVKWAAKKGGQESLQKAKQEGHHLYSKGKAKA